MLDFLTSWDWFPRKRRTAPTHPEHGALTQKVATLQDQVAGLLLEQSELIVERDGLQLQVEALQAAYADLTIAYDTQDTRHEQVSTLAQQAVLLLAQFSLTRKPSQSLMKEVTALLEKAQEAGIVETEKQEEVIP